MLPKTLFMMSTIICCLSLLTTDLQAEETAVSKNEIDDIRSELKKLVTRYEQQILALEKRLQEAEAVLEENAEDTEELAIEISQQGNQQSANTFNPGIGIILNGNFLTTDSKNIESGSEGFGLGESEMNLKANVDDKFYASATLAFGEEVEVEEAYLQTISLDNGFSIKAGRFFSSIGYLNSKHAHTDDFSDRPLAYEAFLGGKFGDDGAQLRWIAPTELFWESGVELYRGESFPAAGSASNGTGAWTAFSHIGGDIDDSQSWRFGLSYLDAKVDGRVSDSGESFTGDSTVWITDFTWKWAPNGNSSINNAIIQAEYLRRDENGMLDDLNGYTVEQDGWYIQGLYQFMPQWRVGLRYSRLTGDNLEHLPESTGLMIDWSNSEFSRFRLQYSQDDSQPDTVNMWILQYIVAFGAHGAHGF